MLLAHQESSMSEFLWQQLNEEMYKVMLIEQCEAQVLAGSPLALKSGG